MTSADTERDNPFLARLRARELTLMLGIRGARTADVVRIAAASGHHAVLIDLEHSSMSFDVAAQLSAAAHDLGLTALVRVPERDYGGIGRLLDGGATGIVMPRVESVAEAELVCAACRFPPRGQRSQIAAVPQLGMRPTPATRSNPALDDMTIVQILLETPAGVAQADAIAALPGVDMLAIGANDLSAELGAPGQYDHPNVRDAVETVVAACERSGKPCMLGGVGDLTLLRRYVAMGVAPLLLTGIDSDLLYTAASTRAETLRSWHEGLVHA